MVAHQRYRRVVSWNFPKRDTDNEYEFCLNKDKRMCVTNGKCVIELESTTLKGMLFELLGKVKDADKEGEEAV